MNLSKVAYFIILFLYLACNTADDSETSSTIVHVERSFHKSIGVMRHGGNFGTGFIIGKDTKAKKYYGMTNGHVFNLDTKNEIGFSNRKGEDWRWYEVEILSVEGEGKVHVHQKTEFPDILKDEAEKFRGDFAIFSLKYDAKTLELLPIDFLDGEISDDAIVHAIGYPTGIDNGAHSTWESANFTPVKNTGTMIFQKNNFFHSSGISNSGGSGSPVFVKNSSKLLGAGLLFKSTTLESFRWIKIDQTKQRSHPQDFGYTVSVFFPFSEIKENFAELDIWKFVKFESVDQVNTAKPLLMRVFTEKTPEGDTKQHVELQEDLFDWPDFLSFSGTPVKNLMAFDKKVQPGFTFLHWGLPLLPYFEYHNPRTGEVRIIHCSHSINLELTCDGNRGGNLNSVLTGEWPEKLE